MSEQEITVVLEFKPEIFDPKKEVLLAIAEEVSKITADPSKATKEDLELINTTKNKLVKARTSIAKAGKAAREAATKYNRDVKSYEDELIAILEPQEIRIKTIEQDIKEYATKQERLKTLPEYKEKLMSIAGVMPNITDEQLLVMDPTQFQEFYNDCREEYFDTLEQQRIEREAKEAEEKAKEAEAKAAEQKKLNDERAEIEREKNRLALEKFNNRIQVLLSLGMTEFGLSYTYKNVTIPTEYIKTYSDIEYEHSLELIKKAIAEVKEQEVAESKAAEDARVVKAAEDARLAAEAKAAQEAKEVEEARVAAETKRKQDEDAAEAKRLANEQLAKDKQEQEKKEEAECLEKLKQSEAYSKWLSDNNYNESTDCLVEDEDAAGKKTILYRTVSEYRN